MPIEIRTSTIQGVKLLYSNGRKCNDGKVQQGADRCRNRHSYASFRLEDLKVSAAEGCMGVLDKMYLYPCQLALGSPTVTLFDPDPPIPVPCLTVYVLTKNRLQCCISPITALIME